MGVDLIKYFGGNGKVDDDSEAELARCILQSQVAVYKALQMAVLEGQSMSNIVVNEVKWVHARKDVIEGLEKFVTSAFDQGAINGREAESILHPLHAAMNKCMVDLKNMSMGKTKSFSPEV